MSDQDKPKYVIISDVDAPQPNMVCQLVAGVGYCYMDRQGKKSRFDGMSGHEATPIEAFGFSACEDADGITRFYRTRDVLSARYRDGKPRRWQHAATVFEYHRLKQAVVREYAA